MLTPGLSAQTSSILWIKVAEYSATWNGRKVPGGIYFYRLQAGRYLDVKKMVLIK
jgi:hypothetical protein